METQMTPNSQNHLEKEQSWRSHALTSDYTTKLRSSKQYGGDFPGGPVVKTSPSNAGGVGSIPVRGTKIPHVSGQLSPSPQDTTREIGRASCRERV